MKNTETETSRDMSTTVDQANYAGYRAHRRSPATGTMVVLVDGHEAGVSTPGDGDERWCLLCDEHGGIITTRTQAQARDLMPDPTDWCSWCQEAHEKREQA